ncbi:T7SS effector LXG polymorphic toxin [Streptococcus suis]|uniref:LXG domain-containing protein n=1 Tax=Streptococcus suis TaxID=1307 RepID=A0AAW5LQA2_STRSU|nr:T7SS effector LXG polymorphic toxin [Streptococcus suis]MCR1233556.1 LXG domain-containing protein [Streptococcus suis]QCE39572.1 hypothetical protein E8M06_09930 [Streptococcus suis]HEM4666099.1 hypothetical protein [Streptococcus suis]
MVKVNLVSMNTHISSVKAISGQRIASLQQVISSLGQFYSAGSLQGQAYDNAKSYAQSTLLPLLKAAILYEESLSEAVKRLPSDYRATEYLEGKSLDSDVLEAELARLESVGMRLERSIDRALEMARDYPDYEWHAHSMMRQLNQVIDRKNKVRRQLQALYAFNERSSSFFSGIGDLETQLSQGIVQIGSDMSNFSGSFPSGLSPVWVSKVNQKWNDRVKRMRDTSSPADFRKLEEREENGAKAVYQDVMQRIENGEEVTAEAVTAALSALQSLGISEVPETLLNKAKEFYNSDAGGYAISGGFTTVEEWLNTFLSGLDDSIPDSSDYWTVYSTGNGYWKNFHASFNSAGYSSALSQSTQNGVLKSLTSSLDIPFSNTGLTAINLSPVSSAFMGLDFAMNLQNENVGRAFLHTAVTTVATTIGVEVVTTGLVAASVGTGFASTVATGLLAMNPVGLAVVTTIGVGLAVNFAYNSNFLGVKDIVNDMGDRMTENLEDIGQALSSGWDSLTGAFGW